MDIKTIISKKRNRKELNDEEIKIFVSKYNKGEVSEAQASALLSYIYQSGLTQKEIISFATEMANVGEKINIGKDIVDKYSTGGVGDKSTVMLLPIIASLGIPISKISSRGMGITSSVIDRLESIKGYNTEISLQEFEQNIDKVGVSVLNRLQNLNPVENKIYKLRNEIACSDCLPIIVASLMSINLCTGNKKVVFEITYGNGTYIKNKEQARQLAKILKSVGKKLDRDVMCVITNMIEPLGYSIGHNLEMIEVINALKGSMPFDLGEVVVSIGSVILSLVNGKKQLRENELIIKQVLRDGKAYEKFVEMIAAQGGDTKYIENPELFEKAEFIMPVLASKEGNIKRIDASMVGSIAEYLGAGRMNSQNEINRSAGIVINKKIGDVVKPGEVLAYIHTNDESKVIGAIKNLEEAFIITKKKVQISSRIIEIL